MKLQAYGITRYYEFNGNDVEKIIFYDDNGIIAEINQGWLENGGDIRSIECGEVVNRNKVKLDKAENFVVKTGNKDYKNKSKLALYLYVDNCNIKMQKTGEEITEHKLDYYLAYSYNYYDILDGEIDGQKISMKIFSKHETMDLKEKKQAQKLYEEIKDEIYDISETAFYRLYNLCKITKRTEKLI